MAVQNIPRPVDEGASEPLLDAAAALSQAHGREMSPDFIVDLYAHAAADDSTAIRRTRSPPSAEDAWLFLLERTPGRRRSPSPRAADARREGARTSSMTTCRSWSIWCCSELDRARPRCPAPGASRFHCRARRQRYAIVHFRGVRRGDGQRESFIHVHVANIEDASAQADVVRAIRAFSPTCASACRTGGAMLARSSEVTAELRANPPPLPADEIAEAVQFLQWIAADNFTLLGARDYAYTDSEHALEPLFETGLGLLRSRDMQLLRRGEQLVTITPEIVEFLKEPKLLIVTKAAVRSRVHRRVHLDYIGVKRFDADGNLVGERRFCGLFTSTAYTRSVRAIPYLRRKVDHIFSRAGFDPSSHSGKALINVLEQYPRDELFQIDEDTLYQFALAILQLDQRPRVRVLPRRDRFDRFVSILVYIPRERYDSQIRARIGETSPLLTKAVRAPSTRFFRKARWCASTSSSDATRARRRISTAPCSIARSKISCAIGSTAWAKHWQRTRRSRRTHCRYVTAAHFRSITAKSTRRQRRWPISRWSRH